MKRERDGAFGEEDDAESEAGSKRRRTRRDGGREESDYRSEISAK